MRALRPFLALALAALASPAAGAGLRAIVWRGPAATPEAARAHLAAWERAEPMVRKFVKLAEGFPKTVPSGMLDGMPPGRHAVVLGFCPAEEADRLVSFLSHVDEVRAGAASRSAPACPVIRREWVRRGPSVAAVGTGTLSVTVFTSERARASGGEGGRTRDGFATAVLRRADGTVLDRRLVGDEGSSVADLEPADAGKRIRASGAHRFDCWVADATWTFEAIGGLVVIQQHDGKLVEAGDCAGKQAK